MHRPSLVSKPYRTLLAAALGLVAHAALAQPANNSANQFGDRQIGHWGDPGAGTFGNPAVGNFDKSQVREPAPRTRPLGKVYRNGQAIEASPYVSLPTPADAAKQPAATAAPIKKPAKKQSKKKAAP